MKFKLIDKEMTRKAAIRTKRGSGPTGMDDNSWLIILASNNFGISDSDLCEAFPNIVQNCVLVLLKLIQQRLFYLAA